MASNSSLNKNLKTIVVCCGIKRNLIFHAGRHTYASAITLSQGVPIESVSSMLGHKKLSTTGIYAKITNDKVGKDMTALNFDGVIFQLSSMYGTIKANLTSHTQSVIFA
jgi:site-specific recombinase XerD